MSEDGEILESFSVYLPFRFFPVYTNREVIWHWFEEQNPLFIVGEVMEGKRVPT